MTKRSLILAAAFLLAHIAVLLPFVPLLAVLPTALGMVSMTSMALSLVLAARWRVVDRITGGPDKSYVAHRWLGFLALAGALGHWGTATSLGAGLVPGLGDAVEEVGTLAASGLLTLSAAAMIRAIPYHLWKASHMLMGPVFLVAAFHTVFVSSPAALGLVPWAIMAGASGLGVLAWAQTLIRKVAPSRLVTVERVVLFDGGGDVTLRAEGKLRAFRPGQFATLAHNRARAEAHPFTIAGGDDTSRRFIIRSAGDWTRSLVDTVQVGDKLRLGRGVGRFLPQTGATRREQLWVAGGVGITPFLAALDRMQPDDGAPVTLIYCTRSRATAGGLACVERHAARLPQVRLIVLSDRNRGGLTAARLQGWMAEMAPACDVYLCGPEGLKALVSEVWAGAGKSGRIHSERFDFRGAYGLTDLIYIGQSMLDSARRTGQTHAPSRS
ncbi:ferric reductase-like transmembrane domain-containing protein [Jannaschia sp. M317]|uniref:ferredoxin reductase family protein n=1 Tax=Jannaschia sp. M317 TaxID=2867011 RepID=UPI0021A41F14|nr:ferric reductase-like transmembrane domain-containing protein [Jannaschia sp. M317]UWQ16963.1 ferric reductase-like transmembrane domain-containing protein [Jannaschia sp. M317]